MRVVLFLAAAVVALGLVASVALLSGGDRGDRVDRRGPVPEEEEVREFADLVAPAAERSSERVAETSPAGEAPVAVATDGAPDGPTGAAFGTLLLPRGFPAPESVDVDGWLVKLDPDGPPATLQPRRRDGTSDGLAWRVDGIRGGSWVFTALAEVGDRVAYGAAKPKLVHSGGDGGPFRIVLHEYVVEGRVTDSSGAPAVGVKVVGSMSTPLPSSSRALGEPEDGTDREWKDAQARADAARARAEAAQQSLLDVEVAGPLAELDLLKSELERAQNEVARALDVRARRLADFALIQQDHEAVTDATGSYRIALRAAGEVRVTAGQSETMDWVVQTKRAEVSEAEPRAIVDLSLQRTAGLEGRLTRSDGGDLTDVEITVRPIASDGEALQTKTDAQGDFLLRGFTPGPHLVYGSVKIGMGRRMNVHGRVDLAAGESLVIEDVLRPAAIVTGRVVDGSGNVVTGTNVTLQARLDALTVHSDRTDAAGRFEIDGLYTCEYVLLSTGKLVDGTRRVVVQQNAGTIDIGDIVMDR